MQVVLHNDHKMVVVVVMVMVIVVVVVVVVVVVRAPLALCFTDYTALRPFNSLFSRTSWVSQHQKGK